MDRLPLRVTSRATIHAGLQARGAPTSLFGSCPVVPIATKFQAHRRLASCARGPDDRKTWSRALDAKRSQTVAPASRRRTYDPNLVLLAERAADVRVRGARCRRGGSDGLPKAATGPVGALRTQLHRILGRGTRAG